MRCIKGKWQTAEAQTVWDVKRGDEQTRQRFYFVAVLVTVSRLEHVCHMSSTT